MGLFDKFRKGLKKTREEGITAQIEDVVDSYEEITDELYEELEEILIMGYVGFPTAEKVIKSLKEKIENYLAELVYKNVNVFLINFN